MKFKTGTCILSLLSILVCAAPALAHHSFTAEYYSDKNVTLTGTLTKVEWVNPHVFLYVDVKDSSGKVTSWAVETVSTVALHRYGAKRAMFVEGQTVTIDGYPAKDGTKALVGLRHIKFQNGTEFNYRNPDAPPPDAK
jgi:DNA/RNA endonuclease YhcR with UshA esterase domain